jgi:6-pyruvoyltetrahydropterin/6-carboxytetrahydropterin synthase
MLSRHPEKCRFPHGHTRQIEVVVAGEQLDAQDMLVDFKALKLAVQEYIDRYDHSMAINSDDPLLPSLRDLYPGEALVIFEGQEPTTEVIARAIFEFVDGVLSNGFVAENYTIPPNSVRLERVRVWETPTSWAEYEK